MKQAILPILEMFRVNFRLLILPVCVILAAAACDTPQPLETNLADAGEGLLLEYRDADAPVRAYDEGGNWVKMSSDSLWAAIARSDGLAHVALKAPGRRRGVYRGARLVSNQEHVRGQAAVLAIAGVRLEKRHAQLPVLRIRLTDAAAVEKIRSLPFVDYLEPALLPQEPGFVEEPTPLMDSGCAYPGWASGTHYFQNGEMIPHRFALMGIEKAWKRSRGRGVVIGVVDTGLDHTQDEMTVSFSSGSSTGRVLRAGSILGAAYSDRPAYDGPCSHGPRMAGLITAPRNSTSTVGVAHEADLVAVRFTDGIVDVDAWNAIMAIEYVANSHPDLSYRRIIPMAWRSSPSGMLNDAIDYYYLTGVLFIGAVGQSACLNPFRGVAWPARKSNVIAVAGVEDNNELPCRMHRGPETDMAALMDYPVPAEWPGQIAEIKESSSATAMVAGVAALIWAHHPTWTRDQVTARIHQSGQYYPNREERRGYGIINAYRAVGGFESLYLGAPVFGEPDGMFTATAMPRGDGPFTYVWSNGATTSTATFASGPYGTQSNIWVRVTDQVENVERTAFATVVSGYEPWVPNCDPNLDPMCPF